MSLARIRPGEIVAAFAAVILLVLLPLRWFELRSEVAMVGQQETGFGSLGWLAVAILLLLALCGLAILVATVTERSPTLPVALNVVTVGLAALGLLVVLFRLVVQPDLGVDVGDGSVAVQFPAYVALPVIFAVGAGAWMAMADERTDTRVSREQTERALAVRGAPRPAPPRHAAARSGPPDALADPAGPDARGS